MKIKKAHGKVYLEKMSGYGWMLTSILVEEQYRGQGIGTALMREALKRCGRPVYLFASSELGGELKRLRLFYERFGFVPCEASQKDGLPYNYNMILEK